MVTVLWWERSGKRNGEIKATAAANLTFYPDLAAVLLYNFATDRKPKSSPSFFARVRRIDLLKPLKNTGELIVGDALTVVLNRK